MDVRLELFESYPFLRELDNDILEKLFERIIVNKYEMGYSLFNNKQTCTGFSFILDGTIRVYRIGDDGKEITLYRLKKGDNCFNTILCVLTESDINSFAEVEENAVIALIPMDFFRKYILDNPSFLKYIFKNLYKKFDDVIGGLEKITFDSIESRLINYFKERMSNTNGSKIIYTTHEKIASDIGTSREVVSRSLKVLEKKDVLELGRGKIKIKDIN